DERKHRRTAGACAGWPRTAPGRAGARRGPWTPARFPLSCSLLAEQEVKHPAAAGVLLGVTAGFEERRVAAPGVLQGVPADGHVGELPIAVGFLCHPDHGAAIPPQPCRVEVRGLERVADDVAQQVGLGGGFVRVNLVGFLLESRTQSRTGLV